MPGLRELLSTDEEKPAKRRLSEVLASEPSESTEVTQKTPVPWHESALMGAGDPLYGAAQLMERTGLPEIPRAVARTLLKGVEKFSPVSSAREIASDFLPSFEPQTAQDIGTRVADREAQYQASRAEAGEQDLDLWRVAGTAANPMSWIGASKATAVWQAVKAGAQVGAFQALLQPVTDTSNFLYAKGMQALTGSAWGAGLGGAVQGLAAPLNRIVDGVRRMGGEPARKAAAASQEVDELLRTAGVDPAKMDPRLYSSIRREVAEAMEAAVDPDPRVITNRADAAALPVPMDMLRGQASGDAAQISFERELAKRPGGEKLYNILTGQNRQLIENMNELGARNALSQFDASKAIISRIDEINNAAKAKIGDAYSQVRDSAGRPARMSTDDFVAKSKNLLTDGRPELADLASLGDYLPETVRKQYNEILSGRLPLTVDTAQFLDRAWGGVQRSAADDTTKKAIGSLRTALDTTSVSDALGEASMAAYKAAREMARERFAMIEANPAYKAVVDGVEPDRFFQRYVTGANASDISNLTKLVGPDVTKEIQKAMVGGLKRIALNKASDEIGTFSQSAYSRVLQDPVYAPRIAALFESDPQTLSQLYRVERVAEKTIRLPWMHTVNTSNTSTNVLRDTAEGWFSNTHPMIGGLRKIGTDYKKAKAVSEAVEQAANPGVTATPVLKQKPSLGRLSDLAARAGGGYAASDRDE